MIKIVNDLNIKKQAEDLGVSVWQTPSFLFFGLGIFLIGIMFVLYYISRNNSSPEVLIASETVVVIIILTIGNFLIKSVESIAMANKAKSEFVSIASHQLKTPISGINWSTELLLSKYGKGLSEKQISIIKDIILSGDKMNRLVNDLLDVARIDQGDLFLASEKIDIMKLTSDIIKQNKILADSCNATVNVVSESGEIKINGDKRRIGVVIDNLISNAIKYIEYGGYVEVRVKKMKKIIVFCVKDNGIGIPESQQRRVFNKFFRSSNSARLKTTGTGLGLYIARNIVEQSGGKMWFKSIEQIGSSFCFSIPINLKK